ncbi:type VI secretion system lipoprotein TssJ [Roseospira goensis]|uniref:Type VI secretion system protein VasD n=1 Tax=Roseospira goensis TaxID=391922 RepID=A0A7W6S114_9PROT|nr:type VI secretion system lipoprotein TssJ [Roseospira goensis]MBB4286254.1 type VI secretion system protein VasD [Roseospira goensis]
MTHAPSHIPRSGITRRAVVAGGVGLLVAGLGACVSTPAPRGPAPISVNLALVADDQVNPNPAGRASPVRVTVFWLRQAAAFQNADFFALADDPAAVLGDDLAGSETLFVRPQSQQSLSGGTRPGVAYVGVVAAYRDLDGVSWRALASLAPGQRNDLVVQLGRFGVTIAQRAVTARRPDAADGQGAR